MVTLRKRKNDITAAFGMYKVNKNVSLQHMKKAKQIEHCSLYTFDQKLARLKNVILLG